MSFEKNRFSILPLPLSPDELVSVVPKASMTFSFLVKDKEDTFGSLPEFWRPPEPVSFVNSSIQGDFGDVWQQSCK